MNDVRLSLVLAALSVLVTYVASIALIYEVSGVGAVPVALHLSIALSCSMLFFSTFFLQPRPLLMMVALYMLLFFLIPGAMHCRLTTFPFYETQYSDDVISKASSIVLTFLSLVCIGYLIGSIRQRDPNLESYVLLADKPGPKYFAAMLICIACSLGAAIVAGPDDLFTARGEIVLQATPLALIMTSIARTCGFLSFIYCVLAGLSQQRSNKYLLAGTFAFFLIMNFPTTIPRYAVASYAITFAFLFTNFSIRFRLSSILFAAVAELTIFPLLSELARGDVENLLDLSPLSYLATHGDFDGMQSTTSVVLMTQQTGFKLGHQLLSALLFFVPREYWSTKSIGTGGDAGTFMGFAFNNLSAPLPAEFYVDFGYAGLVPLSFLFGWFVSKIDEGYYRNIFGGEHLRLVGCLICGYSFIVLRGTLVGVLGPVVLSTCICILIQKYVL